MDPMISKRRLLVGLGGLICTPAVGLAQPGLTPIPMERHEKAMRLAIEQGRKNPYYPYGAVIVRAATGELMAEGANETQSNPVLHGEIVCMNDYVRKRGNRDWEQMLLYTTCEPCPMCMMALVWAKIGGVVFASSSFGAVAASIGGVPSKLSAQDVVDSTSYYKPMLLGGVLAAETDAMFSNRKRF
jgi:tRNA(Arg) A34 adenosine deaminase TadA